MKKIVLAFIFFLCVSQTCIFSQKEVKQNENDGSICYYFDGESTRDSIILLRSGSFKLNSYKIEKDFVVFSLISIRGVTWSYYKVDEIEQSSILQYSGGIGRGDRVMRNKLNVNFRSINQIEIINDRDNAILVEIKYAPEEGIYTIDKKYKQSKETLPIKNLNLAMNKDGQAIQKN